jgi:hypothetical protein
MAEEKHPNTVSRQEFYSTVSLLLLLPAILFLSSGSFPDTLLGQVGAGIVFLTMIGGSFAFSVMAMRERSRQTKEKDPAA